jgi:riboflavin transporter FmnP
VVLAQVRVVPDRVRRTRVALAVLAPVVRVLAVPCIPRAPSPADLLLVDRVHVPALVLALVSARVPALVAHVPEALVAW